MRIGDVFQQNDVIYSAYEGCETYTLLQVSVLEIKRMILKLVMYECTKHIGDESHEKLG